jgi:RNA polymerase sigma-70 factor (ECF subfamily)
LGANAGHGIGRLVRVVVVAVAPGDPESEIDAAARAGDSFEDFYEAHYPAITRLAAALVGRWDVAEELAQDAFLALYPRWDQISRYDAPDAWLRRVALNRAVSALRRRAAERRANSRLDRRVDVGELRVGDADVWRAVAELPKRQAQVIALVALEDRSVAEIARILDCSENTVRTHLGRARRTLAPRFGVEEEER